MEFLLELLLTAVVALLFSFLVAKLVSVSMATGVNDRAEKTEIGLGDRSATVEEISFGLKMDAPVVESERKVRVVVVDENVEHVDRFGTEADKEVEMVVPVVDDDESLAAVSQENVIAKEMIVSGGEETSGEVSDECKEMIVSTAEDESTASETAEEIMNSGKDDRSVCVENVERGEIVVTESEEVMVEESKSGEKSEVNKELSIEEDDDWEGIERSELEKAFVAASNLLEESGKGEDIGVDAKMELYGLHKIATEGSCREAQPMAVMLSARAKWNAWQKLGNMSQEEAMEQYLALVSKEIPGLVNTDHTLGKMPETEISVASPPNSGSLEDPTNLDSTTGVASSKMK